MDLKRISEILFLMTIVGTIVLTLSSATAIKKPAQNHRYQRLKRQSGAGYFFSQNISFGLQPPPPGKETGPWGPWTESSDCSRTCGGGIAFQDRICLSVRTDGSHSCVGASRRYYSCNIQDCPENAKDFREEQCARFNTVPYEMKYYGWLPYYKGQDPCELNCMPQGERFYTRLARKVIDGTRCYDDGSLDVCVDGVCMPVGCDMILGSTTKEDECRECGGDGSSCQFVKGVFDKDDFETGYNDILLIPSGATSIFIKELRPTNNYLAIRNANGEFYLNGNWRIEFPRDLKVAGTIFHYERKPHGFLAPETLRAKGPTTEPLFIVLLYQDANLGVSYEYSIPVGVSTAKPDSYSWTFGDFEECSQTCGGGFQFRPVRCMRNSDRDIVDENLCDPTQKPSINASCNTQPCPARWQIGEWSECSQPCGIGSQFRLVFCHHLKDGNTAVLVPDEVCEDPKPLFMRTCNEATECPQWIVGEWSECNETCGSGYKFREVECRSQENNETIDPAKCKLNLKPLEREECTNGPCEGVEWILSDWSGCAGLCSPRMESREAHCANEDGVVFPDDACESNRLPELTRVCPISSMCEPMWHASEWTECSVNCGAGVQTRVVFCGVWENNSVIKIDEEKCVAEKKFEDVQNCNSSACEGVWFTGPWNRCTSPCGGGERTRKVLCFHEDNVVNDSHCDPNEKPFEKEPCNMESCDGDEIMVFSGCKNLEHGCCADGVTPAGPNFEGCPKMNISENGTCEEAEFGCCSDQFTLALGPFKKGCPSTAYNDTKYECCHDGVCVTHTGPDFEGCPKISNCTNSTFGCCPDGFTPAADENLGGCNITDTFVLPDESSGEECNSTEFGCCEDGMTPAMGPDFEGCDAELLVIVPKDCANTTFGCCEDNVTTATGPSMEGCFDEEGSGELDDIKNCNETLFGCCPDNITAAAGLNDQGCDEDVLSFCDNSTFGCCSDNVTLAIGPNGEGCNCSISLFGCCSDNITFAGPLGCPNATDCSLSDFGCCPDNIALATGPDGEGCNCSISTYGCCSDNITFAGPAGCPNVTDCSLTDFGCCPDNVTLAIGPNGEGCNCSISEFGCCPDNITVAGPEGCPYVTDCSLTDFGCCSDNITLATGPDGEGCNCSISTFGCCADNITFAGPIGCPNATDCFYTDFGCCPDNITAASGPELQGCENDTLATTMSSTTTAKLDESVACENTVFGCCPDEKTMALGPNLQGCCFGLKFGCCPDNLTAALGPTFLGCSCHTYPYGCCPDGITPAQGYRYYGCKCEHFRFGCCRDNLTPASGPNFEGCGCQTMPFGCCPDGTTAMTGPNGEGCGCITTRYGCCSDGTTAMFGPNGEGCGCATTRYGCCPDGATAMTGPNGEGCGCATTRYGCCPDGATAMTGPNSEGCDCATTRYGCCPDGKTTALGTDFSGCPCDALRYGCCPDGRTPAQGLNYEGCPCESTYYGCCADGFTMAKGPNMAGCPEIKRPQEVKSADVCSLSKDSGPCMNYTVKWFFDVNYGGCSRFWYGGCEGNGNVFSTKEQCEQTCVTPEGADACLLPKVIGPCEGKYLSFYYDVGSKSCESFMYSGCLGNNNRFTNKELCERTCIMQEPLKPVDMCTLPKDEGPCDQAVIQWYYNGISERCEQFFYGGCKGNTNRFETRATCEQACLPPTIMDDDVCRQPKKVGSCYDFRERWFYDSEIEQCHRFYFSGCDGNDNNFPSFYECEKRCVKDASVTLSPMEEFKIEFCFLPKDSGPCTSSELHWFYDRSDGVCKEFYYGGCQGNGNRFKTKRECEAGCENSQDICRLPVVKGPCTGSFTQWYYDDASDECIDFVFGGCQGNANRFNSKADCLQQCSKKTATSTTTAPIIADDVCSLPQEPGPCLDYFRMWYYDSGTNACKSFVYGGCDGNENRFEKRIECEQRCVKKLSRVPSVVPIDSAKINNEDVCRLPVDPGPCTEAHERWFYDAQTQSCLPFVYKGCGGNKNRFKSPGICYRFCTGIKAVSSNDVEVPFVPIVTTTTSTTEISITCPPSNCANIQCPFGIEETFDLSGCSTCRCSNPCEAHECPDGSRCSIDILRTSQGSTRTEPVCRRIRKLGECPVQAATDLNVRPITSDCTDRCRDDADCRGDHKCCNNGCANVCMQAEDVFIPATQPVPLSASVSLSDSAPSVGSPIQIDCTVHGPPPGPEVGWYLDGAGIYSDGRREILLNHTLLIKKAKMSDSGEYTCTARHGESVASSSVTIHVEDSADDPNCVDSPQFANCEMIVKAKYCSNKYYGRYCCASCKRAGQLHNWPLD